MAEHQYIKNAQQVFENEIAGMQAVSEKLDDNFVSLVNLCLKTVEAEGKIVIAGVGKSGHVGSKIAATLSSTGTPAVFLHPVEAMHGDLGVLDSRDMVLALSYSGETEELLSVLPAARRFGVSVCALTGNGDSSLSRWSDLTVNLAVPNEACPFNLAPTASTTALLAFGDALAIVLLKQRGFSETQYAQLHPAGAIGRRMTLTVGDIMRTGNRFPCVERTIHVRDALSAMTRARAGSVAVVQENGELAGIFTDGDFRRRIMDDRELLDRPISQVLTANPTTVTQEDMAVDVMRLLEEKQIDDVLVVDEQNRPIGVVDTQDLPKFKLI